MEIVRKASRGRYEANNWTEPAGESVLTAHRLSLDDGIDAAARNARRSERTRGISAIVCALVLGANLTPLAGLGWFFASIFALILCAFVCSRADDDRTLSQPQRVMVVAAI